ncbi:MAG: FtsQ-type POTRA domain-containing protein [Candidatus Staskawiczbacteria bacterium]|nr:FtsQ-type POTRA domain-containing protein [Candidatus Staskawiczbacteria bacterium]
MSYRKKHVKNKIFKITPKKSVFRKFWFWFGMLILALVPVGLYFLLFYPGFYIKDIVISGNEKISNQELQSMVLSNAKSIIFLNTEKLNKEILEKFPIIEKITINKEFPQTLTLGITERKPVGVYCPSAETNIGCFLIDDNGVIYEQLNIFPPNLSIVRQIAIEKGDAVTGENVLEKNVLTVFSKVQKDLNEKFKIKIKEALVTSPLRLNVETDGGWKIYLNLGDDPDINSQIVKLNLLLDGDIDSTVRKTLDYIDLRFKDRAFYK